MRTAFAAILGFIAALAAAQASAEDIGDFYKRQRISLIVGNGTGGGYDVYARVLARYMSNYIPGNPSIIVQNNQNVQFDPVKFLWLGSSSSFVNDAYLLIVRRDAKVKSVEEARRPGGPPIILGSTAEGASSDAIAILLRDWLGFNVKIIPGYRDSGVLFLAIERGEVDGRTVGLSAVRSNRPDWLRSNGLTRVLAAFGRASRHPDFSDAPTSRELARSAEDRNLIEILEIPYQLSRPFAAPPGVPPDRAKALQDAFLAAHKDPGYLADAEKLGIDVSPIGGQEVLGLIGRIAKTPPDQLKRIEKLVTEGG
jgi:tripartite-type tricarboxylate transporter receptor subunit TctC